MLSTLPKLADKTFIFGFLVPSLIFAIAMLLLFADTSAIQPIVAKLSDSSTFENITYVVISTWAIAILLLMFNYQLYRILEGYSWPLADSKLLLNREKQRFIKIVDKISQLEYFRKYYPGDFLASNAQLLQRYRRQILQQFGGRNESYISSVLPTRFGNAIRAFERYPNTAYGADGVTLWLHLNSVMSKDSQSLVADSRSQVDLLINMSMLSIFVGVSALARLMVRFLAVATPEHASSIASALNTYATAFGYMVTSEYKYAVIAICAFIASRVTYLAATNKVYSWGNSVKMAYDCYLPALATQMGYVLPASSSEQRNFWLAVCQRLLYRHPTDFSKWIAAPAPKIAAGKPEADEHGAPEENGDE
jgi:hypothetical protein